MDARSRTDPPYYPREVLREVWDRFPILYYYIHAVLLLQFICTRIPEEMLQANNLGRARLCLTTAIPMSIVTIYYILRAIRSKRTRSIPLTIAVVLLLTAGYSLYIYLSSVSRPVRPLSDASIIRAFEYGQVFWVCVFCIHIWAKKGWPGLALYWGIALIYGVVLENTGIILGYFYEPNFNHYVHRLPAPVCTMVGWVIVMYVCTGIAEAYAALLPDFRWTHLRLAFVTTAVALALDLQLDPVASLSGIYWRWNDALPPSWLGVPMLNFVAWFSAVLPFAYWLQKTQRIPDASPWIKNKQLLLHLHVIIVAAGILNFGLMTVYELFQGYGMMCGPTYQILHQFLDRILPYG